jgi:hypothetical protein
LIPLLIDRGYKVRCVLYSPVGAKTGDSYRDSFTFLATLREKYPLQVALFYIAEGAARSGNEEVLEGALRDCCALVHVPLPYESGREKSNIISTYLDPIVQASLSLYQCALREARRQFRSVDRFSRPFRVVYVGTCYSAEGMDQNGCKSIQGTFWNDANSSEPEIMAKTMAEKALWELHHSEEAEEVHLEVFSLLMPSLLGPVSADMVSLVMNESHFMSENALVLDLLSTTPSSLSPLYMDVLDVRDAAQSCRKSLTRFPSAH